MLLFKSARVFCLKNGFLAGVDVDDAGAAASVVEA